MFWVTNRVFWIIDRVFHVIWLMFSISPMFFVISMFSQLTLCSPIWDGRIAQFVEPWKFHFVPTFPIASVSGFILGGNFYGSIFVNHDIYYVDPSKVLLPSKVSFDVVRIPGIPVAGSTRYFLFNCYFVGLKRWISAPLYDRGADKELPKSPLAPSMVGCACFLHESGYTSLPGRATTFHYHLQ